MNADRALLLALLIAPMVSCENAGAPSAVVATRTYVVTAVTSATGGSSAPPPATYFASGHFYDALDSGMVVLRPDGTASWSMFAHHTANPCYITFNDCTQKIPKVESAEGPYSVLDDAILLPGSRALTAAIPDRARVWPGPDTLNYKGALFGVSGVTLSFTAR